MAEEHFSYGGQAVIEGVMIRGRYGYALACRLGSGEIKVEKHLWEPLSKRNWFVGLPIIRGTPALIEALIIGYRTLMRSANYAAESEGIKPPTTLQYAISILISLLIVIVGFKMGPAAVVKFIPAQTAAGNFLKYLLEGVIKIAAFIGFILFVSRMNEMRRVFQYHGAEHKVIHAYEATGTYTTEEAAPFSTLHPRCGTSFIFTVMFVSILVYAMVSWKNDLLTVVLSRVVLLPVVVGLSYEIIRLAGRFRNSLLLRIMVAPGMWMQKITTQPPTPDMMEVAIAALEGALEFDGAKAPAADEAPLSDESLT